ncbi:MAG: biopolymer transporter ExbD [Deltaproteobacteria bacterium]|jgi:biopolymer transport protein ExbD|nr:biopolymer transporter ExbD [Deltaproteobacteria bacterium]MBW2530469.1 biopolymer transporter ExbD [Deltaproteobacteria bacterium]
MAGGAQADDSDGIISDINVTPLVDITLVLLIVFMVTAKIIVSQSMPLDLPKAASGQQVQLVFGLELHANGDLLVDGKKISEDAALLALARESLAKNKDLRAVIRADTTVQHGRIIRVLDLLKQAGVAKIAFGVTPVAAEPGAVTPPSEAPAGEPAPEGDEPAEDDG